MAVSLQNQRPLQVTMLIVLHLLIVLPLAWYLNIWADEASTLYSTQHGIVETFQHAAAVERQAPLYFWVMSLWRSIDGSIFFARIFSIICTVAAIKLFSGFTQRILPARAALLATAFLALHPVLIWAALEIRVYAMLMLISIALIRCFYDGFFVDDSTSKRASRVWLFVLSIVAVYTNYYLGFLLVGCFTGLLVTRRWREARDYLVLMTGVGIAFLPLVFTFRSQFAVNTSGFYEERTLPDGLRRIWGHFLTYVLPADIVPREDPTPVSIARLWIVRAMIVIAAISAFLRRKRIQPQTLAFGAIVCTILGCLLLAYFLVGTWLVALRHASVLFVPLIIFLALLINDLFSGESRGRLSWSSIAAPVFGMLVLGSFSYSLVNLCPNTAKRGDWARVGAYIQQHETPDQPIVIFHTYDALVLPYHYSGVNRILPDERYFDFDFGTPNQELIKERTAFTISKIPPEASEVWLIENDECKAPQICDQFNAYVAANYEVVDERDFYMQNLQLLRRKAP